MSKDLRPCPFCGLQARIRKINDKHYAVTCIMNCAGTKITTKEKAIEIWNKRAIVWQIKICRPYKSECMRYTITTRVN